VVCPPTSWTAGLGAAPCDAQFNGWVGQYRCECGTGGVARPGRIGIPVKNAMFVFAEDRIAKQTSAGSVVRGACLLLAVPRRRSETSQRALGPIAASRGTREAEGATFYSKLFPFLSPYPRLHPFLFPPAIDLLWPLCTAPVAALNPAGSTARQLWIFAVRIGRRVSISTRFLAASRPNVIAPRLRIRDRRERSSLKGQMIFGYQSVHFVHQWSNRAQQWTTTGSTVTGQSQSESRVPW
jgi:hypothetical protein